MKFQQAGWRVVATMRTPEREKELSRFDNVLVARLDTTDEKSIDVTVSEVIDRYGKIDVLVNNAGIGAHGMFENYSAHEARQLYETNVFGTMNVCRRVLPAMREKEAGTVVNVTSVAGLIGGPGTTIYSGCKFALEGFSESLATEYQAWGIKVCTVAPGSFATPFETTANDKWGNGEGDYGEYGKILGEHMAATIAAMKLQGGQTSDPSEVAEVVFRCATQDCPLHNVAGADAEGLAEMIASIPRQAMLEGMMSGLPKRT